ncbi:hypothetical protein BDA96_01G575200 [Sorghum bicolor]|uniref:RING-type domain-containing protein n=1 Tax=Sorghum bicolor TaxID=4558 RepID=A0A921V4J7_SORBI|nr:hypothetical protein BDA96_01G575200 [Sorghum bicolor]
MGMGDVVQQSGHGRGEAGNGGARVSAAAAAEGGDVGGRPTCCVCMEPWTDSGAHRICCIPCGHVYGRSCLESWLSRGGTTSAKCPQCAKRFALEHIINLYAPGNLWDRRIQAPVTSGPSGSETDLLKQVLDILQEPASIEKEYGVHFDEIVKRFRLPERNIWDALMQHVDMGNIYNTIDDFHFMPAVFEWHPSVQQSYYQQRVLTLQAPVTSGPSGSESDLLKQVLDILHEPANIEREHGVHVDEIVKRFRLPERNIRDAIMQLVDMGCIYNTIDDFHFKSAGIPDLHPSVQQTYYQQRMSTFQAPVTSGPSGSETDLLKQVLDILQEPASIEKQHGVHFDEIVKRFKLPERKIMDALMYHLDAGHIYTTIDDYHFVPVIWG